MIHQVKKQLIEIVNLEINDIEEVVVDNNKYDNPEIIDAEKENGELYDKLVKNKQE